MLSIGLFIGIVAFFVIGTPIVFLLNFSFKEIVEFFKITFEDAIYLLIAIAGIVTICILNPAISSIILGSLPLIFLGSLFCIPKVSPKFNHIIGAIFIATLGLSLVISPLLPLILLGIFVGLVKVSSKTNRIVDYLIVGSCICYLIKELVLNWPISVSILAIVLILVGLIAAFVKVRPAINQIIHKSGIVLLAIPLLAISLLGLYQLFTGNITYSILLLLLPVLLLIGYLASKIRLTAKADSTLTVVGAVAFLFCVIILPNII